MSNHDGEQVLNRVRDAYTKYTIFPSVHALVAVVLWTVAAHLVSEFHFAPRLVVRSAEKRSGKTRLLEIAAELVPEKPIRIANATLAYVFRALASDPPPTVLFDEADTVFGTKKVAENNEELRALLNAGFQRGTPIGRTVGPQHLPTEFDTFAFAALAGIGRMPDTIEDRAVVVQMRRRKRSESVSPYRARRDSPDLHDIREWVAEWAEQVRSTIRYHEPAELGVEDRAADVWESLIAVADMAGGHWPKTARRAARALVAQAVEDDAADSPNVGLLLDIRDVFNDLPGVTFLKSDALCIKLHEIADSPWKQFDLNPSKLGRRLREYQIKTGHNAAGNERGYRLEDFQDGFERYLPPPKLKVADGTSGAKPSEAVRSRQYGPEQGERSDTLKPSDTFEVSEESKPSDEKSTSSGILTGSDGFGRHTDRKPLCEECCRAPARPNNRFCDFCALKTSKQKGRNSA